MLPNRDKFGRFSSTPTPRIPVTDILTKTLHTIKPEVPAETAEVFSLSFNRADGERLMAVLGRAPWRAGGKFYDVLDNKGIKTDLETARFMDAQRDALIKDERERIHRRICDGRVTVDGVVYVCLKVTPEVSSTTL